MSIAYGEGTYHIVRDNWILALGNFFCNEPNIAAECSNIVNE